MRYARIAAGALALGTTALLVGCHAGQRSSIATGPRAMIGADAASAETQWTLAQSGGPIVLGAGDNFGPSLHQIYLAQFDQNGTAVAGVSTDE